MARYHWTGLLALLCTSCSNFQTFDLPTRPAHTLGSSKEKFGLTVAATLLAEPLAIEHQFGPELKAAGYFPMLLFVENRGPGSFELRRDDLAMILENGERFRPASPGPVLAETQRSKGAALLLAPPDPASTPRLSEYR
jgi:hypothetical protein